MKSAPGTHAICTTDSCKPSPWNHAIRTRDSSKSECNPWVLGGFNVSNLMGITQRKIDICKKTTFYFLLNVWKCTVFFAFAFKVKASILYFLGISIGITRRMIDIGKKITFYFLQNVWKCTVFFAFAFKVCKKCYYDPKIFFLKTIIMGIKKTQIFMLISISLMPT